MTLRFIATDWAQALALPMEACRPAVHHCRADGPADDERKTGFYRSLCRRLDKQFSSLFFKTNTQTILFSVVPGIKYSNFHTWKRRRSREAAILKFYEWSLFTLAFVY